MSNWLLFAAWIALTSLNAADAALTRMALKKGHPELNRFTKALIKELGLDKAMLVKALLPIPFVIPIALIWNIPDIAWVATILFLVATVVYVFVLLFNLRQLLRSESTK